MKLKHKVALVTGGTSGIGQAIARLFAREGAQLSVIARRPQRVQSLVDEISASGRRAIGITGDVCHEPDVQKAVSETIRAFGRLDILVNNAGHGARDPSGAPQDLGPLEQLSDEAWQHNLNVFMTSVFRMTRAALPQMIAQGGGSLINISAVTAVKSFPLPIYAYTAAKGGVAAFSRLVAAHYAKYQIRCNCICPALVETELTAPAITDESLRHQLTSLHPLGRLGRPEDIAPAAVYLASDDARWTTGSVLTVDGGWLA